MKDQRSIELTDGRKKGRNPSLTLPLFLEGRWKLNFRVLQGFVISFVLISSIINHHSSFDLYAAPGESTANSLRVDVGARAVAMGGNQFGAEDDSFASFYNPALLSGIKRNEIGFMHNEFIVDLRQEVFTYARPTRKMGVFAGSFNYFTFGEIKGFAADGTPTGDLSASDMFLSGSWARSWDLRIGSKLFKDISSGATLKVLRKVLADSSAIGGAVDVGVAYPFPWQWAKGLRMAGSLQNFGLGLKFEEETSPLPQTARVGLAYSPFGRALTGALDMIVLSDTDMYPSLGLEYKMAKTFAFRAGYKGNDTLEKNFSFGAGFENPAFRLDYAFVPFGELGDTHRVSFQWRFGREFRRKETSRQLENRVKKAKELYAQGHYVEATLVSVQIQQVAPWLTENNRFLESIRGSIDEVQDAYQRHELEAKVRETYQEAENFFIDGNLIEARDRFKAVLSLKPGHPGALEYVRRIEAQFENFVETFYQNGMKAFADEQYLDAKDAFGKVLTLKPDHEEAKEMLEKTEEILELMKEKVQEERIRKALSVNYQQAQKNYSKGLYEDAFSLFRKVLEMEPNHSGAQKYLSLTRKLLEDQYFTRGQELEKRSKWKGAIKAFRRCLNFQASSMDCKRALEYASTRWDLQKKFQSQNLYKEALQKFWDDKKAEAKSICEEAMELDPDNEECSRLIFRLEQ